MSAGARLARRWVRLYTAGLPALIRDRRRAEVESEIWEWEQEVAGGGHARRGQVSARIVAGVLRGALDDLRWRREETRATRGVSARPLDAIAQDLRFGARGLRRDPWFAAVAVLCLALGIGANTAIFSVVHGVLLRALPYPQADQLVLLREYQLDRGMPATWAPGATASYPNFLDWTAQAGVFQGLAATASGGYLMLGADEPLQVRGAPVTTNLFEVLGVRAALGRTLVPGDTDRVIVLSDDLWRRAFGADPDVLGRTVRLDDTPFEIVGVLPPDVMPRTFAELWTPIEHVSHGFLPERNMRMVGVIGRLGDGMTIDRAEADLRLIAERLRREHPEANDGYGLQIVPLHEHEVGRVRSTLLLLLGAISERSGCRCYVAAHSTIGTSPAPRSSWC